MKLIIRQPNARELDWIRFQWVGDLTRRASWDGEKPFIKIGKARIGLETCRQALKLIVPTLLADAQVRVAALSVCPDEAIAWIAWLGDELLYVRVIGDARRRGIATALFEVTGLPIGCSTAFMTNIGSRWVASLAAPTLKEVDDGTDA